MHQQILSQEM